MSNNIENTTKSKFTAKTILITTLVISFLLAGMGVFYYFAVFLPDIERQKLSLEQEKIAQADRESQEKAEQQKQAETAKEQEQQRKESERNLAYANCVDNAQKSYAQNWAKNCKSVASRNTVKLENCLNDESIMTNSLMGENYCRSQFEQTEYNPDCSLPSALADSINESLKESKDRCMEEAKNALL